MAKLENFIWTQTQNCEQAILLCRQAWMQEFQTWVFLIWYDKETDVFNKDMTIVEWLNCLTFSWSNVIIWEVKDDLWTFIMDPLASKQITHPMIEWTPIVDIYCDWFWIAVTSWDHEMQWQQNMLLVWCYWKTAILNLKLAARVPAYIWYNSGNTNSLRYKNTLWSTITTLLSWGILPIYIVWEKNYIIEVWWTPGYTQSHHLWEEHFNWNWSLFWVWWLIDSIWTFYFGKYRNTWISNIAWYKRPWIYQTLITRPDSWDWFILITE